MNGSAAEKAELPSQPLRAILFDVDGTLADSDPLHFLAFKEILLEVCPWLLVAWSKLPSSAGSCALFGIPRGWGPAQRLCFWPFHTFADYRH